MYAMGPRMSRLIEKIVNNLDILFGVSAWMVSAGGFASLYFMSSVYHCQALHIYIPTWFILVVLTVIFRRRPFITGSIK
jgi:hypothetical protein